MRPGPSRAAPAHSREMRAAHAPWNHVNRDECDTPPRMRTKIFNNREEAGRLLVPLLERFENQSPVVLALPRGGVPVGYEIAKALRAPLDIILVRKIGAPWQPELAAAAVVDGPQAETVINENVVRGYGISSEYIEQQAARQLEEIERRRRYYLADRPRAPIAGHTAIVVDDGIATGATVRAALHATRRAEPRRLVLAAPVAPPDTVESLRDEADEIVCLETPEMFGAIGFFYSDFHQISDEEVVAILREATSLGRDTSSKPPRSTGNDTE